MEGLNVFNTLPTRVCYVCKKIEDETAQIIDAKFWLCEECKEALIRVVEREKRSIKHERIMKQLENGDI